MRDGTLGFFNLQVIHNILASLGRVLSHVELEKGLNCVSVIDVHARKPHIRADKCLKFSGRDLSKPLETRHLTASELFHGRIALSLRIAVNGRFLIAHTEEGSFENMDKAQSNNVGKEAKETGD